MSLEFLPVFPDEYFLSSDAITELVHSCRERKRTELIRLSGASGDKLYLFFKYGTFLNAYASNPRGAQVAPVENWEEQIRSTETAFTLVAPLSMYGLMASKLILSGSGNTELLKSTSELADFLNPLSSQMQPFAVQLGWNEASSIVIYPGGSSAPYSLYISRYSVLDGSGFGSALAHRREANCRVVIHEPDLEHDTWREYFLKRTFQEIYKRVLVRFESLTGRALADSLTRLLAIYAARKDLQIGVSGRVLDDQEVFPSSHEAGMLYQDLLSEIFDQFSTVVGPDLLRSTLREILTNLPTHEQMIARSYKLFPEAVLHE